MNGWRHWIVGIAGGLMVLGIGGALGLSFSLSSSVAVAQEAIIHNAGNAVGLRAVVAINTDEIDENEEKVDRIETEWEWFKDQYRGDQREDREAHKAILEKLDELEG